MPKYAKQPFSLTFWSRAIYSSWHLAEPRSWTTSLWKPHYSCIPCISRINSLRPSDAFMPFRPFGTSCSEILIEIHIYQLKKMLLQMLSGNWRPFCLSLVLTGITVNNSKTDWGLSAVVCYLLFLSMTEFTCSVSLISMNHELSCLIYIAITGASQWIS